MTGTMRVTLWRVATSTRSLHCPGPGPGLRMAETVAGPSSSSRGRQEAGMAVANVPRLVNGHHEWAVSHHRETPPLTAGTGPNTATCLR